MNVTDFNQAGGARVEDSVGRNLPAVGFDRGRADSVRNACVEIAEWVPALPTGVFRERVHAKSRAVPLSMVECTLFVRRT
jgi:hypothetical protein